MPNRKVVCQAHFVQSRMMEKAICYTLTKVPRAERRIHPCLRSSLHYERSAPPSINGECL